MKIYTRQFQLLWVLILAFTASWAQSPVTSPSFGNACIASGDVSWTNPGTVNTILVFAKATTPITIGTPSANISTYSTASADFSSPGTAYQNDASAFLVYSGTASSVSLTGLNANTTYHFLIFNANGTSYSTAATTSGNTLAAPGNAGSFGANAITNNSLGLTWADPTTCFDEVLIVGKTSSVSGAPTGGAAAYPTQNLDFVAAIAPDFDAGAKVLYKGVNATPTIANLAGSTTYFFKIFTRKTTTWSSGTEISATTLPSPVTGPTFTSTTCVDLGTVSWTNPSIVNTLLVFAKAGSTPINAGTPTSNISTYVTASTNWASPGTAYQNDPSAFLIYKNTSGTSVNLTNLTPGNYQFLILNATGTSYSSPVTFSSATLSAPPNVTGYTPTPQDGSIQLNWANPSCADNILIVAKQGGTVTGAPSTNSYTGNLNFGAATTQGFPAGEKIVYFGSAPPITVSNLINGTTYFFKAFTIKNNLWSSGVEVSSSPVDLTPPTIALTDPLDDELNVATDVTYTITFNENIQVSAVASSTANDTDILVKAGATTVQTVPRASLTGFNGTNTITFVASPVLSTSTNYYVLIGDKVLTDMAGNAFAGIASNTVLNFTTSAGVTRTTGSATANTATFTTISNIVLTENGKNDFAVGASRTLKLALSASGYILDPTSPPTVTFAPSANITSTSVSAIDFTSITITYSVASTNKLDVLTISGLKVKTSSTGNPNVDIVRVAGASDGTISNAGLGSIFATVGSCATSSPALTGVGLGAGNSVCLNGSLSGKSVSATGTGSIKWYNDAGLSSEIVALAGNMTPSLTALGFTNSPVGSQTRYATLTSGCQSAATSFTITVSPLPTANAGTDKTGASAVCPGVDIILGGSPTLTNSTGPGPYSYSWTGPSFTSSSPNPILTTANTGTTDQTSAYSVVVTEGSTGCSSLPSNIQVTVKNISEVLAFTPSDGSSFLTTSPAVDLLPSITGGSFSGIGVLTVTNPSPPPAQKTQFSPSAAGVGTFGIRYDAILSNGCPKSVTNNYSVSTGFTFYNFSYNTSGAFTSPAPLPSEFCNSEFPVEIRITSGALQNIINYVHTWNTIYVVSYGYSPITFNGFIRNYYEFGQYGFGVNGSVTYPGGTYSVNYVDPVDGLTKSKTLPRTIFDPRQLATNNAYPTRPTFTGAYLMAYMEFASAAATSPYTIGASQDLSYAFNVGGALGKTYLSYSGWFVTVNPVPIVSFSGLTSGLVTPDQFCNLTPPTPYKVTGNKPNGASGFFEISFDNSTYTKASPPSKGLTDLNNGSANFDPQVAFFDAGNPASAQSVYIRYSVDPLTTGSTGTNKCIGVTAPQLIFVNPLPTINWDSAVPADNSNFCYEGARVDLTTDQSINVVFGGFGVVNNTNSTGYFVPKVAFDQKNLGSTAIESISISATFTNNIGCKSTINRVYNVYPKPNAIFTPNNKTSFCFDDPSILINGNTPSSSYKVSYQTPTPYDSTFNSQSFTFNPKAFFNSAVQPAKGGSPRSDIQFLVSYTTSDGIGCTSNFSRTFTVSPKLDIAIAGVSKNEVYCANTGTRTITLTPKNGNFFVDNLPVTITNGDTYLLNKPNGGIGTKLLYSVTSGITGCVSKDSTFVNILPSPVANFSIGNQCSGVPGNFIAVSNSNNKFWRWNFNDGTPLVSGNVQSTNHTFSTSSDRSFAVQLYVEADPAAAFGNRVCKDSVTRNVVVGAIPQVDFDFSNVCETDQTNFQIKLLNPLSTSLAEAAWEFGDGIIVPSGLVNATVTGVTNTTGTFSKPNHLYNIASTFTVKSIGKTTVGCVSSNTRTLAILKKLIASPASIYSMTSVNALEWKIEDRNDSSRWIFGVPNKTSFKPSNQAWVTGLSGDYKANDQSFVNSPCFDLSAFTKPAISLDYWTDTERGIDGTVLQFSTDGGLNWSNIGTFLSGSNTSTGISWYNEQNIQGGNPGAQNLVAWSRQGDTEWSNAKHSLDVIPAVSRQKVRFRVAFGSNANKQLGGFAFHNVQIVERNRLLLVENFTNEKVNSNIFANNNTGYQGINSTEIVKIQYNTSFPGNDAVNQNNPADHGARAAFYGIINGTNVPVGFVDGLTKGNFTTNWSAATSLLRSLVASDFELTIVSQPATPSSIAATVTIKAINSIPAGKRINLFFAVVEKTSGNYQFVMRKMLPTASGIPIQLPLAPGQTVPNIPTFNWEVASGVNPAQLAFIAFIQELDESQDIVDKTLKRKEVLQSFLLSNPNNLPSIVTGTEPDLVSLLSFYPIPADKELVVSLPEVATQNTPLVMYDAVGKSVHQTAIDKGQQSKTISTQEFAPGVYLIQLETDKGIVRKKVMVVH